MKNWNYHDKTFISVSNSVSGEVDEVTKFHYEVSSQILIGTYSGGKIVSGQILGKVNEDGSLNFNYQHINIDGKIKSGKCFSTPELLEDGRCRLHESWQWMDSNGESGTSIVEEIRPQ